MTRKQELLFRLFGSIAFILALVIVPLISQRCSVAPPELPGFTALPLSSRTPVWTRPLESPVEPAITVVFDSPLPEPVVTTAFDSPLPEPTLPPPDPTATAIPDAASTEPTPTPTPDAASAEPAATPTPDAASTEPTATPTPQPPAPTVTTTFDSPLPGPLPTASPDRVRTYRVVHVYPHDPEAFTQGLVYLDGLLYEGTGLNGQSTLRRVDLETGEVLDSRSLPDQFFGEGIAIIDDRIFQLTWLSNVGFIYDLMSFEQIDSFGYPTQGWGLTYDGTHLIMSDGTPTLHFMDPETLEDVRTLQVLDQGTPVHRLNELEYIDGVVYANVWKTDRIARIDPESGEVIDWIDLSGLLAHGDAADRVDVLNGIAYDAVLDRLFVTGKLWPNLFEIEVVHQGE